MTINMKYLVAVLPFLISSICIAQDSNKELDTKKMMDTINQISKEAEGWAAKQKAIARERQQQCIDAFGHEKFCSCLNKELHWVLGFESYIKIITAPTIEAASNSSPDERAAIESVLKTREKCVGKYFSDGK